MGESQSVGNSAQVRSCLLSCGSASARMRVEFDLCRLLGLARSGHILLPTQIHNSLQRAAELHERCCEQERIQELVHQGLRYSNLETNALGKGA